MQQQTTYQVQQPTEATTVIHSTPNLTPVQQQQQQNFPDHTPIHMIDHQQQQQQSQMQQQTPQLPVNVPMVQNQSIPSNSNSTGTNTHQLEVTNVIHLSQPQGASMSSGIGTQPSSVTTGASIGSVSSVSSSGMATGQSSATSSITAAGMAPGTGSSKSKSTKRRLNKSSERPKLQVDNVENGTVHCVLENRLKTIKFKFDIGDMNPEEIANNLVSGWNNVGVRICN